MDLGHYTTAMIGSRTRGSAGGRFLFAARTWDGTVPDGIDEVVRSDSDIIKVMARIMTIGGDDLAVARRYMDQWKIETLSQHLGVLGPASKERHYPDPDSTNWLQRVNFVLGDGSMATATPHGWRSIRPSAWSRAGSSSPMTNFRPLHVARRSVCNALSIWHRP